MGYKQLEGPGLIIFTTYFSFICDCHFQYNFNDAKMYPELYFAKNIMYLSAFLICLFGLVDLELINFDFLQRSSRSLEQYHPVSLFI